MEVSKTSSSVPDYHIYKVLDAVIGEELRCKREPGPDTNRSDRYAVTVKNGIITCHLRVNIINLFLFLRTGNEVTCRVIVHGGVWLHVLTQDSRPLQSRSVAWSSYSSKDNCAMVLENSTCKQATGCNTLLTKLFVSKKCFMFFYFCQFQWMTKIFWWWLFQNYRSITFSM